MKTHLMKLALLLLITAFVACGSDDAASDSDTSADVQDDSSAEVTPDTVDPDAVDPDTVDPDTVDPDTVDPCEDGDLQCADDAILQVCADGVWTQEADCTAQGQICLEHTCVDETPEVGYVGQDKCKSCHSGMNADIVAAFEASGHPFKITKVVDGQKPVYPYSELPDFGGTSIEVAGYSDYTDISYVIGGYGWKARFMGDDGFIITGDEDNSGVQYNLANGEWVAYHTGEQKPFTCGNCHTTGWVATGEEGPFQDDLPGIHGTWVDEGVTCEGCHGPGEAHAAAPASDNINGAPDSLVCAKCHVRGAAMDKIPASGGLVKHHEQYQEMIAGPHGDHPDGCMACHDAHASTKYDDEAPGMGVKKACNECHDTVAHNHEAKGVSCKDCHMPKTVKSAVKTTIAGVDFGDIAGHVLTLSVDPAATLTAKDADGAEWATGVVPVKYACLSCHDDKDADWAVDNAADVHAAMVPCEDGDLQCADDAILQVCADGVWTQEADCTAQGQICLEHTCVDETPEVGYVGQDKCKSCHSGMNADIVAAFEASGHPFKITKVVDGQKPVYPYSELPDFGGTSIEVAGYSDYTDISYVIGGYGWKARFMGDDGFIITGDEDNSGVQYNLANGEWVAYHTGEQKPFTCGNCHTTGWVATGEEGPFQDDLPGIHGTWVDEGVTCEGCHGPGEAHAAAPASDNINGAPDSLVCAKCHVRGAAMDKIPASGGLIKHHEQYQEMLAGPHANHADGCMACHDAHASTKYDDQAPGMGVKKACAECHDAVTHSHSTKGVSCKDCHMPKVVKSAVKTTIGELAYGDIAGHILTLSLDPAATLTAKDADDAEWATGVVPVKYSCLSCHDDKDANWAITNAANIH